jgi:hypothetical protein
MGSNLNAAHAAIGQLTCEIGDLKVTVHEGFARLGARLGETRRLLTSVSSEVEDTKTHELRMLRRERSRWKWGFITAMFLVTSGVVTTLILHGLHVGT